MNEDLYKRVEMMARFQRFENPQIWGLLRAVLADMGERGMTTAQAADVLEAAGISLLPWQKKRAYEERADG